MLKYIASEIFEIQVDIQRTFPLNLEFMLKNQESNSFRGPGIYFLYFKHELVYIGFFYDSSIKSDVRTHRWNKELATISMRGKQVVFTQKAFDYHQRCLNYPVFKGEVSKNGVQTSANRLLFVDKNWDSFRTNDFLEDFTFYWFREEKNLNKSKHDLTRLTEELKQFYKPICNK
jgi:hypothetical protein